MLKVSDKSYTYSWTLGQPTPSVSSYTVTSIYVDGAEFEWLQAIGVILKAKTSPLDITGIQAPPVWFHIKKAIDIAAADNKVVNYIEKDGVPWPAPNFEVWVQYMQKHARVALSQLPVQKLTVSTVFLGTDLSWGSGASALYETMVFDSDGEGIDLDSQRYSTREDALIGHRKMVADFRASVDVDALRGMLT
jgi:hypothetical protein